MSLFRSSPSGKEAGELLRGVGLEVTASGRLSPCARPGRYYDWDYFCSGSNASGAIGRMGWTLGGTGTPAFTRVASTLSSASKANLSTSNVNNQFSWLSLGAVATQAMLTSIDTSTYQWAWRMNNSLTTKRVYGGWSSNFGTNPNTGNIAAFGVLYDSSVSPNYLIMNKFGTAFNQNFNTGVPVPQNSGQLFTIARNDSPGNHYDFLVATESAGVVSEQYLARDIELELGNGVTSTINCGFSVTTLAAVASTVELGYWGLSTRTFGPSLFASTSLFFDG